MTVPVEIKTLKAIANIKAGYQTRTKIPENQEGTYRLIQGTDFDSQKNLQTDRLLKFIPERNPGLYEVHEGDVLLQARGFDHFAYCIVEPLENTLVSGTFYIIRLKVVGILPGYLAWWINQPPGQHYLESQAGRSSVSYVSMNTLAGLPVKVPTIEIQQKIEKTEKLWQRERSLQNRLTTARERLVQAVCLKSIEEVKS